MKTKRRSPLSLAGSGSRGRGAGKRRNKAKKQARRVENAKKIDAPLWPARCTGYRPPTVVSSGAWRVRVGRFASLRALAQQPCRILTACPSFWTPVTPILGSILQAGQMTTARKDQYQLKFRLAKKGPSTNDSACASGETEARPLYEAMAK